MADMVPDRTYVSLILSGPTLDPDFWSSYFDVQADKSAIKGGDYVHRTGKKITSNSRRGLWLWSSRERVDSLRIDDHIDFINSRLGLSNRDIRKALVEHGADLLFSCFVGNYSGLNPPVVNDDKRLIANCGGRIEFDVYPQIHEFVCKDGKEIDVIV